MDYLKLVTTVDLEVEVGEALEGLRLEVFQASSDAHHFRIRLWQQKLFLMTANIPPHLVSSESIFIDIDWVLERTDFIADSPDEALLKAIDEIDKYVSKNKGS